MRTLTCIVIAGALLIGVGPAAAQAPDNIRPGVLINTPPPPPGSARSPLAVRERLLSFDADHDLRISRSELPDRMQGLIARGDKNADGALDFVEIDALVNAAASERTRVAFRPQPSEGLAGVINDLKLPPEKHERALAIVSAQKPTPHVNEPPRDIYKAMRLVLDDEEYENFVAAAERLSKTAPIRMGIGGGIRSVPPPPTVR